MKLRRSISALDKCSTSHKEEQKFYTTERHKQWVLCYCGPATPPAPLKPRTPMIHLLPVVSHRDFLTFASHRMCPENECIIHLHIYLLSLLHHDPTNVKVIHIK